jgi:hypothetical protein
MLYRMTPLSRVPPGNPLYRADTRGIPWARGEHSFRRASLSWAGFAAGAVVVTWLAILGLSLLMMPDFSQITLAQISITSLTMAFFTALMSGALSLGLDYAALQASMSSFQREFVSGRWALLRVTPMREGHIILAKHAASQVRNWRLAMWIVGMRLGAVLVALFAALTEIGNLMVEDVENAQRIANLPQVPWAVWVAFTAVATLILLLVAVAEPLSRSAAMSSVGLAISASDHGGTLAVMLAAAAIFGMFVLQMSCALGYLVVLLFSGAIFLFSTPGPFYVISSWLILFVAIYLMLNLAALTIIRGFGLRHTARRLARREE